MRLLGKLFGEKERETAITIGTTSTSFHTSASSTAEIRYEAGDLFYEGEGLRKAGRVDEAEQKYLASIASGEASETWTKYGPPPAMYEALAKLYYHSFRDEAALATLDRYFGLLAGLGKDDPKNMTLRERMARGTFRRVKIKTQQSAGNPFAEASRSAKKTEAPRSEPSDGFYVYIHRNCSGKIFYVGKGAGRRAWDMNSRHPVWKRYVEKTGGTVSVELVRHGLDKDAALDLEDALLNQYGQQLVNWFNPGRDQDYEAIKKYWEQRKENEALLARARLSEETDLDEAVEAYRQAVKSMMTYEEIVTERGLVADLSSEIWDSEKAGNLQILDRLTICLKKLGRDEELVDAVDKYLLEFPGAGQRSGFIPINKRADQARLRISKHSA